MPTETEYVLFAANAYSASRAVVYEDNDIPIPSGWELIKLTSNSGVNNATGFLARAYRQGNEVVVSYAGTTFEDGLKGLELDFRNGNLPAASGLTLAAQVVDAARFYLDVRKTYPGADVSFTGHSLGGGLASLMAVFFDKPAHVFDQAPFEATAKSASVVAELKTALSKDYALQTLAPEFLSYQAGSTHKAREYRVQLTYLDGEILRDFPAYLAIAGAVFGPGGALALGGMALLAASEIAGPSPHVVSPGGNGVSPLTRHDSRLLAALLLSPPLLSATQANADFLQEVFKSPLRAHGGRTAGACRCREARIDFWQHAA